MSRRIIHALGFGTREFSVITLSSAAVFVALQVFIGNFSRRGLDLTDEGYYMNSIHWADHYQAGVSGFGDFYGILYVSLGQDFGALREINSWLSWVLWSILGWFFVQYMVTRGVWHLRWDQKLLGAVVAGTFSTFSLHWWISTPSYNSLAFQGVTVFAIGLLLLQMYGIPSAAVLGLGLALSFMGKPTTALALAILIVVAAPPNRLRNALVFISSGVISLSLVAVWGIVIDGSISRYLSRILQGLEFTSTGDQGQIFWQGNLFRRLAESFWPFYRLELWSMSLLMLAIVGLSLSIAAAGLGRPKITAKKIAVFLIGCTLFVSSLVLLLANRGAGIYSQITLIVFLSIALMSTWKMIQLRTRNNGEGLHKNLRPEWNLTIVFFLLPIAYAFGTNTNYWESGATIGGMFLGSALLLASNTLGLSKHSLKAASRVSVISVSATFLILVIIVAGASLHPYRQNVIVLDMRTSAVFPGLFTSDSVEKYLRDLRRVSKTYLIDVETPIIDNSGVSPTAVFALGGIPLGSAWLIGGYEGSKTLASDQLSLYSDACIASAWILDAPTGSFRVFNLEDGSAPLTVSSKYQLVASFTHPFYGENQVLYRPVSQPASGSDVCKQVLPTG